MDNRPASNSAATFVSKAISALERIGLKSLVTGNFPWFVLLLLGGFLIYKLDSGDLKEVLMTVLGRVGWLGYPCAVITVYVCRRSLKWREQFYKSEMDRIADVKRTLMQQGFELPLESSVQNRERQHK